MLEIIEAKFNLKLPGDVKDEYDRCISDLVEDKMVYALENYSHHLNCSRLEHCLHVSCLSYLVCKKRGLNYRAAARGGLLHDFYFYDSHQSKPERGIHCMCHPAIALENAEKHFPLNKMEKDIIVKHMWPVTVRPPKYQESFIVSFMDKYCATREVAQYVRGCRYRGARRARIG